MKALRIGVGALVLTPLVLLISLSGHVGFVGLVREATEPLVLQALRQGRQIELEAPGQPVVEMTAATWARGWRWW